MKEHSKTLIAEKKLPVDLGKENVFFLISKKLKQKLISIYIWGISKLQT